MNYEEVLPAPALRRYVECFWTVSSRGRPAPPHVGLILPDGCVELVLNFADAIKRHDENNRPEGQPRRMVVGQIERCVRIKHAGRADYIGVRFRPAGARPFLRLPLGELTNQILRLDSLSPDLDKQLENRIDPACPTGRRTSALEGILLQHLAGTERPNDVVVEAAVHLIQQTQGMVSVSSLMSELGISGRQLERKFRHSVGIGPKLLCRIMRFRRVCRTAEQSAESRSWTDMAAECGYYDQAHLIHDFRQFSGDSPTRLFTEEWGASDRIRRV